MAKVAAPPEIVRLIEAVNSGASTDFVVSFSEDAVVDDFGREIRGRQAIRQWSDIELIGDSCRVHVRRIRRLKDDTVEVRAHMVSTGFNGPTKLTFRLRDGFVEKLSLKS
jgi:hypothetical protein